jgi:hypothetical protein
LVPNENKILELSLFCNDGVGDQRRAVLIVRRSASERRVAASPFIPSR